MLCPILGPFSGGFLLPLEKMVFHKENQEQITKKSHQHRWEGTGFQLEMKSV